MSAALPKINNVDSIYYRDGVDNSFAMRVLMKARATMFDMFMREMAPDQNTSVLDIGVSDDENDGANFLEKNYPWPGKITCAGLGNGQAVKRAYPQVQFRTIRPGERLPFADQSFDVACSNAVLEHVGDTEARKHFIREHLRVARKVFITFPNRWFPIEHHTSVPFLHYSPTLFRRVFASGKYAYWTDPKNMDFLDRAKLMAEWPDATRKPTLVALTGLKLGLASSNVVVVVK